MPATVTVEGFDRVKAHLKNAVERFEEDLREATLDAAAAGIMAAQEHHEYQDHREPGKSYDAGGAIGLTDTAHAEQPHGGSQRIGFSADMVWPAPYGKFVDRGTSRSAAYPFTPTAETTADLILKDQVDRAVANFRRNAG